MNYIEAKEHLALQRKPGISGPAAKLFRRGRYLWGLVETAPRQALMVDIIRFQVCLLRYIWFVWIVRRLRVWDGATPIVSRNTISHNLKGMKDLAVIRSLQLIRPLVSIDKVRCDIENQKVLTIGPRSEGEIFNLLAYGFRRRNISGLDLISYSPYIKTGDLHAMPFCDSTFDVVMLGWVLAYSDDRARAAAEVIRVAKDGALVAIGSEYSPKTNEEIIQETGYLPGSFERIFSLSDITRLFEGHIDQVYFSHPVARGLEDRIGQLILIFSIKK